MVIYRDAVGTSIEQQTSLQILRTWDRFATNRNTAARTVPSEIERFAFVEQLQLKLEDWLFDYET